MSSLWKSLVACVFSIFLSLFVFSGPFVSAISFDKDVVKALLKDDQGETVYDFSDKVDRDQPLTQSLKNLFYPPIFGDEQVEGGELWRLIRTIGVGLLVVLLIWAGGRLILFNQDEAERKKSILNLVFIVYGSLLFFGVTWILGTVLDIGNIQGLTEGPDSLLETAENTLILQAIGLLKAFSFFLAIIMLTWYGRRMMMAIDSEDKQKIATRGMINVVVALVFIKVIDFLYFLAQTGDFQSKAISTITSISLFLGYFFGIILFLLIIYIGFLFLTSAGNEDNISRAKTWLRNLVIIILVVYLFLLLVYQVFNSISL